MLSNNPQSSVSLCCRTTPNPEPISVNAMLSHHSFFKFLIILACVGCAPEQEHAEAQDLLALSRQFYDELNAEMSLEVFDRWLTPDYVLHRAGSDEPIDLEGYLAGFPPLFDAITDLKHVFVESVVQGDRIALYIDISMKHVGTYAGFEATGRTINVSEMLILRWENGKIAEEWLVFDSATFLSELQSP